MKKFVLNFILLTVFTLLGSAGKAKPLPHRYLWDQTRITNLPMNKSVAAANDSIGLMLVEKPVQDTLINAKRKRIKEVARAKPQAKPEKIKPAVTRPPAGNPGNGRPAVPGNGPNVRPGGSGQGQGQGARPGQGGTRAQPAPGRRGP